VEEWKTKVMPPSLTIYKTPQTNLLIFHDGLRQQMRQHFGFG